MNKIQSALARTVSLLLIAGVAISCGDDFFDVETGGRIDPSQHYNSLIDVDLSYSGCFIYLQEIAEKMVLVDGLLSDQMDVTANADRDMIDINRHDLNANNPYFDPSSFYKLIININEVIPNLPQILGKDRDFDSTLLFQYTGHLTTLRSWAYFTLAKLNGEVGMVDGDLHVIDPSQPPLYLSKQVLINKLIEELLPYTDEDDIFRYYIDQYVLLGELYLEKNDYTNAAKYLKFAIDGPSHRGSFMVSGQYGKQAWVNIFINSEEQATTVFSAVPYSFVNGQKNNLEEWMLYDSRYMVKPVESLISFFENEVQANGDPGDLYRGDGITYRRTFDGIPYISKYSLDEGIPHSADVILYRDADIHLLLAEALNRLGQTTNALTLLNNGFISITTDRPVDYVRWAGNKGVRGRVSLKEKTVPGGTENAMLYIEDLILEERAKELAFEGKRWFDLVRIANRRQDPAYLADKVAAKFDDPATAAYVRNKLMDPANWYLPVPKVQ